MTAPIQPEPGSDHGGRWYASIKDVANRAGRIADAGLGFDPVAKGGAQPIARLPLDSQVRERAPLTLRFDPRRLHVFDSRSGRRLTDLDV